MSVSRKLTTIFYADVAGYSRLTAADEEGTHARVMAMLDDAAAAIGASGGSVLRYAGDAILATFPSVVQAVEVSAAIQADLAGLNEGLPEDSHLNIRIGVNLGDVIEDRGEVYGDGVNLAARLEAAARPGGICISAAVHDQIAGKVKLSFDDGGEVSFKNIGKPVQIFHWPQGAGKEIEVTAPQVEGRRGAAHKPSIAVLPFDNMSADPEQEFFADGLTEDLITALSRNRQYDVTSRNSTFAYKGKARDIREIAGALGVDFVLEGSVRSGGGRARITAQLINARTGNHEWADRFDRRLDDVFAVQDEITLRVTTVLSERMWQSVAKDIRQKTPDQYGPYEWVGSAIGLIHQIQPESIDVAKEHCARALEMDPDLAAGHLGMGFCFLIDWVFMGDLDGTALEIALEHGIRYRELAPDDANVYRMLSRVYTGMGKIDEARQCVERALKINPYDGDILLNKGLFILNTEGPGDSFDWFDRVLDIHAETPHSGDIARLWKALALFIAAEYAPAISLTREIAGLSHARNLLLSACHAQDGDKAAARQSVEIVMEGRPGLRVLNLGLCKSFQRPEDRARLSNALEQAGIPA